MKRFTIQKIKMPRNILGFSRGIGWEIRDHQEKLILDVLPTKKLANDFVTIAKKNISKNEK